MQRTWRRLATLLAVFSAIPSFVVAQTNPTRGFSVIADDEDDHPVEVQLYRKMAAVVIGIDQYADPRLNLSYATHDAQGMEEVLRERYGFDPVYTLYDAEATKDNILELLQTRLPHETVEDDAVLIFFSGHGDTVQTATGPLGYLVPHDGAFQQGHRNISMSVLRDDVSRALPARHVCFIVDACYGGLLATTRGGAVATSRSAAYLQSISKEPARQVLTAGDESQTVLDGGPLGYAVFTGRVIQTLQDATEYITANELSVSVAEHVFEDARARGHVQTPKFGSLSGTGDFVFVPRRRSLADIHAETERLERQLAESQRAQQQSNAQTQAQELQRQAELEEQLRLTQMAAKLERERQARAREAADRRWQGEERKRQEEADRLAAEQEAVRLRRKLEEQQARDDALSEATTLSTALDQFEALRTRVDEVERQVRRDIVSQKDLIRPARVRLVEPRGEFETEDEYASRRQQIERQNEGERAREKTEDVALDDALPKRIREAQAGFQAAINELRAREFPVASEAVELTLERYNVDEGYFPVRVTIQGDTEGASAGRLVLPRRDAQAVRTAEEQGLLQARAYGRISAGEPSTTRLDLTMPHTGDSYTVELTPASTMARRPALRLSPSRGTSRAVAASSSLLLPGLGQHLNGRHSRGIAYEVAVGLAGAAVVVATLHHRQTLDDYNALRLQVESQAPLHTELTPELQDLSAQQLNAYDDTQSARKLAVAARIAAATIWVVNALDSTLTTPQRGHGALTFGARTSRQGVLAALSLRF